MVDDPNTEPLREWNRIARENAENAIVSSMFQAASKAREPVETFTTWLLVAAAAVASFLITNADKLLPLIEKEGFIVCGGFLCISCIFGLLSKIYALRSNIGIQIDTSIRTTFSEHLSNYEKEEEEIKKGAEFWGIRLETRIRIERVLTEFYKPFPRFVAWLAMRHIKKNASNPQIAYLLLIKNLNKQSLFAFLQSLSFLGFLISGITYAALCS
jgi:uncharacterized membrane protein (DUF441 family)